VSDQYVADVSATSVTFNTVIVNAVGGRANFGGFASVVNGRFYSAPSGVVGSGYFEVSAEL
jgi:hypothetical protein